MRKRIGLIRLYSGISGTLEYYNMQELGLARALDALEYDVYIFLLHDKRKDAELHVMEINEHITILNIPTLCVGSHGYFNCSVLLKYEVDIVHLESDNQLFAIHVIKFCELNHIFLYNYLGTIESNTNNYIKRYLMKIVMKLNVLYYKKHLCITKTPYVKKQLLGMGLKNIHVCPVGLDLAETIDIKESKVYLRNQFNLPINKRILLFVGRLEEYKKPIEALELIEELGLDYYLVMIGNGKLKSVIKAEINKRNLNSRVCCIDKILNKDIHKYYKCSDYFINMNSNEIFGMSILEAMYQRCIVIARHAPGPDFIIEDGISGFLFYTVKDAVFCIQNEKNVVQISNAARMRVEDHFTWQNSACRIMKLVRGGVK